MCEELSIKQQDPKSSPLCQLHFEAALRRLPLCHLQEGKRASEEDSSPSGVTYCRLFLLFHPGAFGTSKHSQAQQPSTNACLVGPG